jgi:hypothetical protein
MFVSSDSLVHHLLRREVVSEADTVITRCERVYIRDRIGVSSPDGKCHFIEANKMDPSLLLPASAD